MATGTRPGTTVEEIYQTLRERIVEGRYMPGFRMSQGALAADLETSRTPLREALHRLEADGLLVAEANRGMQVAPASDEAVEECYAMRLLIEPPTVAAITLDLSDAELAAMEDALDEMDSKRHRTRDYQEAHLRFHELALSHYPAAFREVVRSLHMKIYRHQRLYFSRPEVPGDFTHVDRVFLAAIRDRDGGLAKQLLEFHLIDAAMGMILDKEPDHTFDSLLTAARGVGIEIEPPSGDQADRHTTVRWHRSDARVLPPLATTTIQYVPESKEAPAREGTG